MTARARVAIIGSARYAVREPFAGGLEAHTWALARALRQRGHEVTVFAGPGCDPELDVREIPVRWPRISEAARADVSMTADAWLAEHPSVRLTTFAKAPVDKKPDPTIRR